MEVLMRKSVLEFAWNSNEMIYRISLLIHRPEYLCLPLKWPWGILRPRIDITQC
jgi:hypothetical protein